MAKRPIAGSGINQTTQDILDQLHNDRLTLMADSHAVQSVTRQLIDKRFALARTARQDRANAQERATKRSAAVPRHNR
jgi:hypothetical protein